jgi:Cu2+-exporting ATPase
MATATVTTPTGGGSNAAATFLADCLHCGLSLPAGADDGFCCAGCRTVHGLLHDERLTRYYDLGGAKGRAVRDVAEGRRDRLWLEPLEAKLAGSGGAARVSLDVQGIRCTACVWLIEEIFRRHSCGLEAIVNPALGRVELTVEPAFGLRPFVEAVERFGYVFGPPRKREESETDGLLVRVGICVALAMNSMVFGAVSYFGLEEGPVFTLIGRINHLLGLLAVLVGGSLFIRSAWEGLRRGVLHLDVPIALGILLAFGGSVWSWLFAGGRASYVDTVAIFIALMVLGRWLQARVVERNRRQLLVSDGAEGILTRRVNDGVVELVPCPRLVAGDHLVIAPGDLVPVDAVLLGGDASCSLDWIVGESRPRRYRAGDTIPAGAFNVGQRALSLSAVTGFAGSPLVRLLETPAPRAEASLRSAFFRRVVAGWVTLVLAAAGLGFGGWLVATGDVVRALEVATAVLVVTCPCGFGIATPLAYELAHAGLRRAGLFVRSGDLLDRAAQVRRVVFDKTGTVTTGSLRIVDPAPLAALPPDERGLLYNLAARSAHPKSLAAKRALEAIGGAALRWSADLEVTEHPGQGLVAATSGRTLRLGAPAWAAPGAALPPEADLVWSIDGVLHAVLRTEEELRPGAKGEIARLAREGHEVWILSGDSQARAQALAEVVGVPAERAVGGASPEGKALWLAQHDRQDTLMIGDGLNDSLVVERAYCSGTPAIDRPFLPARADFVFVTPGLAPVGLALRVARGLGAVVRRNLRWAIAYNVFAVALAWAGVMAPWLAAILMPASSLFILGGTFVSLSGRSPLWKS